MDQSDCRILLPYCTVVRILQSESILIGSLGVDPIMQSAVNITRAHNNPESGSFL